MKDQRILIGHAGEDLHMGDVVVLDYKDGKCLIWRAKPGDEESFFKKEDEDG